MALEDLRLFDSSTEAANLHTIPQRPLGEFSELVMNLGRLPPNPADRLALIHGLSQQTEDTLSDSSTQALVRSNLATGNRKEMSLSRLDLQLMANVIKASGGNIGPLLQQYVDQYAEVMGMVPTVTYEDLVENNPSTDIRTATGTLDEEHFLFAHKLIEEKWRRAISGIDVAIEACINHDYETAAQSTHQANLAYRRGIGRLMHIHNKMNGEQFNYFRLYFDPIRSDLKGASGQYTATQPIIDLLVYGDKLPPEYFAYLEQSMKYLPVWGQQRIQEVRSQIEEGKTLRTLTTGLPKDSNLLLAVNSLADATNKFRSHHQQTVKHFLPGYESGTTLGSGGSTGNFLNDRKIMTGGL